MVAAVVMGASAMAFETVRDYGLTSLFSAKENAAQKKVDASELPFTVSVQPERGEPDSWTMLLDRELTADETQKMQESSSPFSYLRDLGGHPLQYASLLENAPERYREQQFASGRLENVDTFKIGFLSTRAYPVMIDDWKVVDLTCVKSTRKTVVSRPAQGGAAYEGISLHLPPRADEPVLTDDTEGQGKPYFDSRFIEVGGGQSVGALRVEAIAPPGQSCEWGIEVHYTDAHHQDEYVQLKDGNGSPLRIHTESAPENPRQKWVFGSVPWTPCHLNPQGDSCDLA
ncbi:hypothetical protein [Micromonospora parathelypteridis]|uniref:Uncharacterized protein n=1 Tax=Micromonospora parathelypteridis TaxID=1839617 RepID=A0A840W5S5_9ACTN|nr:hypothetical protein [Micromonospora parathelypteridis]MBB5480428.1 hypothetical protein [Micromonospora parathelypteridis]